MNEKETRKAKKARLQSLGLIALVVVIVGLIILSQAKDSLFNFHTRPLLQKGVEAPNFTLPDLNGKMVSLTDYRGKVVFLNIWATWCPPCVEEMPSMEKLYQKMKGQDFEILAVSIDVTGAKDVGPFMKKYNLHFPALLDTEGSIKALYQTTGVPETFIIDKQGNIAKKVIGARDWASPDAFQFIQQLIQSN